MYRSRKLVMLDTIAHYWPQLPSVRESLTMSADEKLIDLGAERAKRVHDLNDKRLNEVRNAFEQAMPLESGKKKSKKKPKKR